jgi:hypothetical protein
VPRVRRAPLFALAGVAAVALGVAAALAHAWVCDDAFISFRYALHLVRGEGLVFNTGERVEGYSNPLWTLLMALGLVLGRDLEPWSVLWGVVFHAGTLALLAWRAWSAGRAAPFWALPLPAAALVAAVHPDFAIHATSGLETSLYTFLVLAGFVALTGPRRPVPLLAGALLALAALTRPDGVLFAGLGLAFAAVETVRSHRPRPALPFAAAFLVLWAPATLARIRYYGDYFPNTYYAKSGGLAWWSQGLTYVGLYFERYWAVLAGFVAGGLALWLVGRGRATPGDATPGRRVLAAALLALAASVAYLLYIARVGGDFMYARMLLPVTPLLLVVGETGLGVLVRGTAARVAMIAAAVAATALTPAPVTGLRWVSGVADEWDYYVNVRHGWAEQGRRDGELLHRYFEGLPIGVGFIGAEARLVYYADPAVAVETETGLTDAFVAHQPLLVRGRVGHEKRAPAEYLLRERRLLLVLSPAASEKLGLDERLPYVPIAFDGFEARLLRWDPSLLESLAARGARFPNVPALLDGYLARSAGAPPAVLRADYARFRTFYFDSVRDEAREAAFRRVLADTSGAGGTLAERPGGPSAPP